MYILLSFAYFERNMIAQRTQEGKAIAKTNNSEFKEGRPSKSDQDQLDNAMKLLKTNSYTQVIKLTGISRSRLVQEKKTS